MSQYPYTSLHHNSSINTCRQVNILVSLLKTNKNVQRTLFLEQYPIISNIILDTDDITFTHDDYCPAWYINTGIGLVVIETDNVYTVLNGDVSELRGIPSDHDSFIAVQSLELQRLTILKELLS
jgi:nitric oxide synthase oxygenase domain/subunit